MEAVFDSFAPTYDDDFTNTLIGKCQREQVWTYLSNNLPAGPLKVLEVNCGTGADACWLAQQGHRVVATDISPVMVGTTQQKVEQLGLANQIQTHTLGIEEINRSSVGGEFDLIFSNFGGWNCLSPEQIQQVRQNLQACLKPGGRLIAVIMPDRCWWETLYFLGRGLVKKAFRRRTGQAPFTTPSGDTAITYYFRPITFASWWKPHFSIQTIQGVGFWVPPSYLNHLFLSRPQWVERFHGKDMRSPAKRLARFADHCIVDLSLDS